MVGRLVAAGVALAALTAGDSGAQPVPPCGVEAAALRDDSTVRDLRYGRSGDCDVWLASLVADPAQPWDVRGRALTLLEVERRRGAVEAFVRGFDPAEVARDPTGAATFNHLAAWLPVRGAGRELVEPLLLPGVDGSKVDGVLAALAGQPVHDYLRWLLQRGVALEPQQLRALAETDDQDTRRLLCWYVGDRRLAGMEGFLVDQLASPRPSTFPGQARRLFEAAFTAGLSELLREAERRPPWLADDTSPKGLALASLALLIPADSPLEDRQLVARLAAIAVAEAAATERSGWTVAADVVTFLLERGEPAGVPVERTLGLLARQPLRRRGPLEPLVRAEAACRRFGVPFPQLTAAERGRLWEVALTTLDAPFLGAIDRAVPEADGRQRLETQLLGQGEQAARGTLRVSRCLGCDLETPGDWCAAVAELGLGAAVAHVEGVLATPWADDAVAALVCFGPAGVPALARFLVTERARQLSPPARLAAVRACVEGLPPAEAESLLERLGAEPALAAAVREVVGR